LGTVRRGAVRYDATCIIDAGGICSSGSVRGIREWIREWKNNVFEIREWVPTEARHGTARHGAAWHVSYRRAVGILLTLGGLPISSDRVVGGR
jgi:hypothetical protein